MTGCTVDTFKRRLDKYLLTILNEPQILGYTAHRRADSNSLVDMTSLAYQDNGVEVPGDTQTVTPGSFGVRSAIAMI